MLLTYGSGAWILFEGDAVLVVGRGCVAACAWREFAHVGASCAASTDTMGVCAWLVALETAATDGAPTSGAPHSSDGP